VAKRVAEGRATVFSPVWHHLECLRKSYMRMVGSRLVLSILPMLSLTRWRGGRDLDTERDNGGLLQSKFCEEVDMAGGGNPNLTNVAGAGRLWEFKLREYLKLKFVLGPLVTRNSLVN
jgi:hypothetical protein